MFKWDESYSVGIPLIDAQHQRLFEIANQINEMLKTDLEFNEDSFNQIMDEQDKLVDYTKYHFSQEEKLMSFYGYNDINTHVAEHQKFIKYLEDFDYTKVNRFPRESILELVKFITQWIFNHILSSDFAFKDHILDAMKREQLSN